MNVVMEKSLNMKNWQKVMTFFNQSWNVTNFAPEFCQICAFFADVKTFSIHFIGSLQNVVNGRFGQRDCHGQLRNDHGEVMEKSCKNNLQCRWEPCCP